MNTTLKKPGNPDVQTRDRKAKGATPTRKAASAKHAPRIDNGILRQAEALQASQLVIELDNVGQVLHANQRLLNLLGLTSDELIGTTISAVMPKTNQATLLYKNMLQVLPSGKIEDGEYLLIAKDESERWIEFTFHPIRQDDGAVEKTLVIGSDITAKKILQSRVEEMQVYVDVVNMTSIVSESDLKGDILSINNKFVEISKYSEEELIGAPHSTTRHPDMPKEVFKELWSTIGRGKPFRGMIKNRAKDGEPYYVDAVIAPVMGENGKPRKYIGIRYDVTQSEIARHNADGILEAINASYAFVEFDMDANVVFANENFLKVMGYKLEEAVGKPHRDFVDPKFAKSSEYSQFWADLKAGQAKSGTVRRLTKDGREVWLQGVYCPVKDEMGRVAKVRQNHDRCDGRETSQRRSRGATSCHRKSAGGDRVQFGREHSHRERKLFVDDGVSSRGDCRKTPPHVCKG
jgi:methyl-accepting chemotaxis protein